jgi:hypothetical protein
MIEQIKQVLQDFLAPQLEAIRGDIRAMDAKFEAKFALLDTKIDSMRREIELMRREFSAETRRIDQKFTAEIHANSG